MAEWHPDTIERLRTLWDDESLSAAEIGRRLGKSKNAVVGKAHRLDLPARPSPIRTNGETRPRVHKAHRAGAITLPMFDRWCLQCHGKLGPEQQEFCSVTCNAMHQLAKLTTRKPAPKPKVKPISEPVVTTVFRPLPSSPCQWPLTSCRPWRFCDDPSMPGKPYCETHARDAYVKIRDPRDDDDLSMQVAA